MINKIEADWFHINIMDGVFILNVSYDMPVLTEIRGLKYTSRIKVLTTYLDNLP